ncbi:MAG TPA: DNA polymerase III subunit gamma/tau, partial [Caulobacterales bacterium]|nr:DNA polymerase III subunit gamma/tau [Caulobacterales bacterium]
SPAQLSRLWQMLLKALEDVAKAPEPIAATEMAAVRLAAAAGLPPPEDAAKLLRAAAERPSDAPPAAAPASEAPGLLNKFEDVVALLGERRLVELQIEAERYILLRAFSPGRIVYAPAPGAPIDLALRLSRALQEITGETWELEEESAPAAAPPAVESLAARRRREEQAAMEELKRHPFIADALKAFPGADIVEVREAAKKEAGEVIDMTPTLKRKKEG